MPQQASIQPNQSYTFSHYFELQADPEALLSYFDYSFAKIFLELPKETFDREEASKLKRKIIERLPKIFFSAETARREVLVSPVILSLID
ncbi:MAG: hypothetical protein ACFB4I_02150 [Cyanophyceae cyanobacterium]